MLGLTLKLAAVPLLSIAILADYNNAIDQNNNSQQDPPNSTYWIQRRDQFYKNTTFLLSEDNRRLIGGKYSRTQEAHLPFWFDYQLFKKVFGKTAAATAEEELARHRVYINTCMRTIISRTLYRMLAATHDSFITSDADMLNSEKNNPLIGKQDDKADDKIVSLSFDIKFEHNYGNESPIERAVRLMRQEIDRVESKNQIETYLRAFNEEDGSAISGRLPY